MVSISDTPEEYRLRILAEECAELAQAALKMIRAKEHDTPISEVDAKVQLVEESADVMLCIDHVLTERQKQIVNDFMSIKAERWEQRLNANAEILQNGSR